ncbi:hypothetical protein [Cupriavidus sp. PET2-C1]
MKAWNVWRVDGVIQAWIGNAGMIVEGNAEKIKFRCSDGTSEPEFDDFIALLMIESKLN